MALADWVLQKQFSIRSVHECRKMEKSGPTIQDPDEVRYEGLKDHEGLTKKRSRFNLVSDVLFDMYALTLGIPKMFAIKANEVTVLPDEYSTMVCVSSVIRPSSLARRIILSAMSNMSCISVL